MNANKIILEGMFDKIRICSNSGGQVAGVQGRPSGIYFIYLHKIILWKKWNWRCFSVYVQNKCPPLKVGTYLIQLQSGHTYNSCCQDEQQLLSGWTKSAARTAASIRTNNSSWPIYTSAVVRTCNSCWQYIYSTAVRTHSSYWQCTQQSSQNKTVTIMPVEQLLPTQVAAAEAA